MNEEQIFDKLAELTGEKEPICVAIQTETDCFVYGNGKLHKLKPKDKQSICFSLMHTIVNTFADYN